jgi:hypothetical protein
MQIGAPGDKDREIERNDPGEQTQGQTEGEASAPASAGDYVTLEPSASQRRVGQIVGTYRPLGTGTRVRGAANQDDLWLSERAGWLSSSVE